MNTNFRIKNAKADSVIGMYVDEPIGMDHPLFMVRFQSRIDAGSLYHNYTPLQNAIQSTVKRMRDIFGDDIPEELVRTAVTLVYAENDALQPMQPYLRILINLVYVEGVEDYVKGVNAAVEEFIRIMVGIDRTNAELVKDEFLKTVKPKNEYPQINVRGPSNVTNAAFPANASKGKLVAQAVEIVMRTGKRVRIVWSEFETIYAELTDKLGIQSSCIKLCVVWAESKAIDIDPENWRTKLEVKYPHILISGQKECILFYPDTMAKEDLIEKAKELLATGGRVCIAWSPTETIWPDQQQKAIQNALPRHFSDEKLEVEIDIRLSNEARAKGQPVFVLIMGPICAGKTTLRRERFSHGYVLIDAAQLFIDLGGIELNFPSVLEKPMETIGVELAQRALAARMNIVTEIIGAQYEPAKEMIDAILAIGYHVEICAVKLDLPTCIEREKKPSAG